MTLPGQDAGPLGRAFALLDFVAGQRKAVTAAEIAVGVGLPVATAHRLIGTLEDRGLLVRAPGTRRYVVGNALVLLAGRTIGSAFRTARRHAVLRAVAAEIGEQCEIGIVRDAAVSYVDSVRALPSQGLQFDPGGGAPLHCSSTGKIYHAHLSIDAVGHPAVCFALIAPLRRRGRHVHVGLLLAVQSTPALPMSRVIAHEFEILGSHGMQAWRYSAMLAMIALGGIDPERLVGRLISLDDAVPQLTLMGQDWEPGMAIIDRFA